MLAYVQLALHRNDQPLTNNALSNSENRQLVLIKWQQQYSKSLWAPKHHLLFKFFFKNKAYMSCEKKLPRLHIISLATQSKDGSTKV